MNVHCLFLSTSKIICSAWCSCWPVTFWFHSAGAPIAGQLFNTHLGKTLQMSLVSSSHLIKSFLPNSMYSSPSLTVSVLQWEIIVIFCVPSQSHCWGYNTLPHFGNLLVKEWFCSASWRSFFSVVLFNTLLKKTQAEFLFYFLWFQVLISNAENKDGAGGPGNIKDLMFPRDPSELERTATESAQHEVVIMVRHKIHNHISGK